MGLQDIIEKTREYLDVPSVVRYESPFLDYLADDFNVSGYEVEKNDRSLVVRKKGLRSNRVITAHIDRHGIVINEEGRPEYAAFSARKYYGSEIKSSEAIFRKSGERFIDEAVYAYDKSGRKIEEGRVRAFSYDFDSKHLIFEIDGFDKLPIGTPIAYASQLIRERGNLSSQIDNVISVAVAHQLVKDGFDGTLIFATEEEIGRSWRYIVEDLESCNYISKEILTMDTTPYDDIRAILEGSVVFRNKDENAEFNLGLVQRLKDICDFNDIKYDVKDEIIETYNSQLDCDIKPKKLGITELGRIVQSTEGRFNGATVQIPTLDYHTNHETTSELCLSNYYRVFKLLF